jgi:hypothetical protein
VQPDVLDAGIQGGVSTAAALALDGTVTAGRECTGSVTIDGVDVACDDPSGRKLKAPAPSSSTALLVRSYRRIQARR